MVSNRVPQNSSQIEAAQGKKQLERRLPMVGLVNMNVHGRLREAESTWLQELLATGCGN